MHKPTMETGQYEKQIIELISQDPLRLQALDVVFRLNLPQCYIAAGFVRNLIWDHLHHKASPTTLNDVDVIYFDASEKSVSKYAEYEAQLKADMPELNWQVRNQARMHDRNGDKPYAKVRKESMSAFHLSDLNPCLTCKLLTIQGEHWMYFMVVSAPRTG